jgi:hypothetical protein
LRPTNCFVDPKLGSISSLRCQKSRTRIRKDATCEVMFRGRYIWGRVGPSSLFELRRGSLRYDRLARPKLAQPAKAGGARRDRTDDLMLAKHALSQLSYGPVPEDECLLACQPKLASTSPPSPHSASKTRVDALYGLRRGSLGSLREQRLVGLGRLELPTSRLSSARSNQLSYKPLTLIL